MGWSCLEKLVLGIELSNSVRKRTALLSHALTGTLYLLPLLCDV